MASLEADLARRAVDAAPGETLSLTLSSITARLDALENGRVESPAAGGTVVASAYVQADGTVAGSDGAWIIGASHTEPGKYVLAISPGTFATPPFCTATCFVGGTNRIAVVESVNTSEVRILAASMDNTPNDIDFFINCVGAR